MSEEEPGFTVAVDSREALPYEFGGTVPILRTKLDVGDYSVASMTDRVAIERKSLADAVQSVTHERERFWRCLERLSKLEQRAVVIEASVADVRNHAYRSKASPASILGSLNAITVDFGIPVHWAGNREEAETWTLWVLQRFWKRDQTAKAA